MGACTTGDDGGVRGFDGWHILMISSSACRAWSVLLSPAAITYCIAFVRLAASNSLTLVNSCGPSHGLLLWRILKIPSCCICRDVFARFSSFPSRRGSDAIVGMCAAGAGGKLKTMLSVGVPLGVNTGGGGDGPGIPGQARQVRDPITCCSMFSSIAGVAGGIGVTIDDPDTWQTACGAFALGAFTVDSSDLLPPTIRRMSTTFALLSSPACCKVSVLLRS